MKTEAEGLMGGIGLVDHCFEVVHVVVVVVVVVDDIVDEVVVEKKG